MSSLDLTWNADGNIDSYNVYRSELPMNVNSLPLALATGITDKSYSDAAISLGVKYYYRASSIKGGVERVSDEISLLAGTEWTPANLSNPSKLWFSYENVTKDDSNRISQITDLSGNNSFASQSTDSKKPVLLNDSIKFDGVDDLTDINNLSMFKNVGHGWVMCVYKRDFNDTTDIERPIIGWTAPGSASFRFSLIGGFATSKNRMYVGGRRLDTDAYSPAVCPFDLTLGQYYIVFGHINYLENKIQLYIDGTLVAEKLNAFASGAGLTPDTASLRARFGANGGSTTTYHLNGSIKSMIVGNTDITTEQRQRLEGWAAHKYGLAASLPSDHPYKTLIPVL